MNNISPRDKLLKEIITLLGGNMVEVELTPDDLNLALDLALDRYRQRSSRSVDERFAFLDLQPNQTIYYLPDEVIEVRQMFRRGTTGTMSGAGVYFDPFASAVTNQYLLAGGSQGSLVTYELFTGYQELIGKMFGYHVIFSWNQTEHRLEVSRNIRAPETVLMWIYNYRPEESLLKDTYARPWLRDYTLARARLILSEIRGKFGSIIGPQGGTSLNGSELKNDALTEIERLDRELNTQTEQTMGYGFFIG